MLKRRSDQSAETNDTAKRRKQSLIQSVKANPLDQNGLSQCYRKVKARMHVFLAPAFTASPIAGIQKQHLDPLLLQYNSDLSGVVVSYLNVKLLRKRGTSEPLGQILGESPFSFYWITVDLLLWCPKVGDVVEGWISVQSPGHIALLINDTFNASIQRAEIPQSWSFISQEDDENGSKSLGYWQDDQGNRIDGKLQFTVKKYLNEGRTVLVLGSLLTIDDVKLPQIDSKHKKFEAHHTDSNGYANSHANVESEFSPTTPKPGPKKTKFDD